MKKKKAKIVSIKFRETDMRQIRQICSTLGIQHLQEFILLAVRNEAERDIEEVGASEDTVNPNYSQGHFWEAM